MTYHCGIGPGLGMLAREPHVTCDGCGNMASGETSKGWPKAWLRNGKAPPGWKMVRVEEPFSRKDWCPRCKSTPRTDLETRKELTEKRAAKVIGRRK